MNTHDIKLPPLPPGYKSYEFPDGGYDADDIQAYARAAIEADRKHKQSEAEEVCAEAYQVVGSLLSDLGIFETKHAKQILDNLSQAKMVHKDVLPWPSFDRKRRGEPVKVNAIFETENGEVIGTTVAKVKRVEWQDDSSLTVVIDYWPQPAEPEKVPSNGHAHEN